MPSRAAPGTLAYQAVRRQPASASQRATARRRAPQPCRPSLGSAPRIQQTRCTGEVLDACIERQRATSARTPGVWTVAASLFGRADLRLADVAPPPGPRLRTTLAMATLMARRLADETTVSWRDRVECPSRDGMTRGKDLSRHSKLSTEACSLTAAHAQVTVPARTMAGARHRHLGMALATRACPTGRATVPWTERLHAFERALDALAGGQLSALRASRCRRSTCRSSFGG